MENCSSFWFWFWRPAAEMLGGVIIAVIVVITVGVIVLGIDLYREWQVKRGK